MKRHLNRFAANAVLLVHFAFVLFAVFGALLAFINSRWMWVHVPVVLWSSVVNLASWTCPLTPLENAYRRAAGEGFEGGFIQHYVGSLVYPKGMPRRLELIAGVSVLVGNVVLYAAVLGFQFLAGDR
jgi:hypothetical protein